MYRERPVAYRRPRRTSPEAVEKILEIRSEHQFGALRIMYYLDRYHGIKISESTVSRVLKAHGMSRLPKTAPKRALHTKRYAKTVPGHHVQVDVKFLQLKNREGKLEKRYQYTAIDDATRIRALRSIRSITRLVRSSSSIMWLKNFPSGSARSEPTEGMNFKLVFTGMSKTRACGICTSNPKHPN